MSQKPFTVCILLSITLLDNQNTYFNLGEVWAKYFRLKKEGIKRVGK